MKFHITSLTVAPATLTIHNARGSYGAMALSIVSQVTGSRHASAGSGGRGGERPEVYVCVPAAEK